MERPKVTPKLIKRPLTGEVVYLGEMRQLEQFPSLIVICRTWQYKCTKRAPRC